MISSSENLLQLAKGTLHSALADLTEDGVRARLEAVETVLNELILREDHTFYGELAKEAVALEGAAGMFVLEPGSAGSKVLPGGSGHTAVEAMLRRLRAASRRLRGQNGEGVESWRGRVTRWEAKVYGRSMTDVAAISGQEQPGASFTVGNLLAYLRSKFPQYPDLAIAECRSLPGGFSKLTMILTLVGAGELGERIVLRIQPPMSTVGLDSQELISEYGAVRFAAANGLPIATPLWLEPDPELLGLRFFASEWRDGRSLGSFKEASEAVPPELLKPLAEVLAKLSNTHPDANDPDVRASHLARWAAHADVRQGTDALIDYWYDRANSRGVVSPTLERLYDWLKTNVPAGGGKPSLVHGDFGFHNLLVDGVRITTLLDWEASYAGDPAADMANLFFCAGESVPREALMTIYEAAGGRPISPFRLAYFDVFNVFKMFVGSVVPLYILNETSRAPISFAVLGLRYLSFIVDRVEGVIAAAERWRAEDGS